MLASALVACEQSITVNGPSHPVQPDPASRVLGVAQGEEITRADAEGAVLPQLYDLEIQRFRLLREVIEAKLLRGLDAVDMRERIAEIRLEPPMPPRMKVPLNPERSRPEGSYPVEIVTFCNLESAHCVRLQEQFSRILPMFEGVTQFSDRELILPFHRHAQLAAEAAFCALEQGHYWQFRDLLFAGSGPPDHSRIFAAGRGSGLQMDQFQRCLESGAHGATLAADAALARSLRLTRVPAVFVNGLYAGANPEPGHLIWLIETELQRQGIDSPRKHPANIQSREPLHLTALIHGKHPGQGIAVIASRGAPDSGSFYREGDALGADLTLRRVSVDRIEVSRGGVTEWLDFNAPPPGVVTPSGSPEAADVDPKAHVVLKHPHRGVPVVLDRTEVLVHLTDIVGLEASLEPVPMTAGGYHLLKITDIQPGGLYESLGLEKGDVIVLVNEQPMHEGDKPLWNALQSEDEVRLRIMRQGGLAHHYTYRFQD